jgi:hypothetical protein
MPKRIPTPPPPDDEPRYLTVVHPYPLNANLMTHADRRTLALWLACCTGKDVLLAMYYKPAVSLSCAALARYGYGVVADDVRNAGPWNGHHRGRSRL